MKTKRSGTRIIAATALLAALIATTLVMLPRPQAASGNNVNSLSQLYKRPAPTFDLNATSGVQALRQATGEQLSAIQGLRTAANAPNMQMRWNAFGGSPDAIYDFASQPFSGTPEEAGRAFLTQNAAAFGITDVANLRLFSQREALGGYLIRFQQTFNDIPVKDGGIGLVMNANKQIVMATGPFFRNITVNTTPSLTAAQARAAADADLNQFSVNIPSHISDLLQTGLNNLTQQAAAAANIEPSLGIYPTADGFRLVWKVAKFSTNPFGHYMVTIDAHTGETVARKDFVNFQTAPGAETADIYPKYPQIDASLKDDGVISTCSGPQGPRPCGQERVQLRSFDPQNRVTGVNGTLIGTHALVNNALASKQPFLQAGLGTWHFRVDNPTGFEARTNELDQMAEPAEHQDEINAFFFVTYLLEYVDHLHVAGDNGTLGGRFPDDYPNKTVPLPATVHIPNIYLALDATGGSLPSPSDPDLAQKVLGLDNAFALNLTSLIEAVTATKSPVVVNPTSYGHGFLLNDLALEGTVPYHEGMHAITSPIAGLEGDPEGSALNEGQADMWAFTITDNPSLGDYVVNAHKYRQRFRDLGRDPDSIAYIRSARSTLKYGDIGTLLDRATGAPVFEEHYDGEIYMSTMWDIREMFNRIYPQSGTYKRPRTSDGQALKSITKGTEIFERDFLGSMYVLGTTAPDSMVKARDAMIVADQMLYPSDATDPDAPGKHRAMIEQIFAAKELGINAVEVVGGQATISTQTSHFTGDQSAPAIPSGVTSAPETARSVKVSWNGVSGATAYQVLRRKDGFENLRQPNGRREFADGDSSTTGYKHVAFVDGNRNYFEDKGAIHEVFAPEGLSDLFDHEYVVRAIGVNSSGQLGFSEFSATTQPTKQRQDLTAQVDTAISNISFASGVMAFDNKLTNARGAFSTDTTIYAPMEFKIVSISNPTVTVRNADSDNTFFYNQTLTLGATSGARRLEFNDPAAQIFSFDARIYGNAFAGAANGTTPGGSPGTSNPPTPVTYSIFRENKTGTLLAGEPTATGGTSATWGDPAFKGITWDDVLITTKSDALFIDATLSSATAVDLDFELRTTDGQILDDSAGATAAERVGAAVQPNTTYVLRVKGFANGPSTFNIVSDQLLPNNSPNANSGTTGGGSGSGGGITNPVGGLVRFTVNPILRTVQIRLL
ncbi:MAG: M36 family metallopeptidase [Pyrinomonadaceae bacterium]|nr:M36 family metallopeptidase [Pyrinomonadaceae bacterium]